MCFPVVKTGYSDHAVGDSNHIVACENDIGNQIHIVARAEETGDPIKDAFLRIRDKLTASVLEGSEMHWDTVYVTPFLIDTLITVPAGAVPGNYDIELYTNDQTFNVSYGRCEIYIKPN